MYTKTNATINLREIIQENKRKLYFTAILKAIIYCDVVCYREKEGEVSSLSLLYLESTVKIVYKKVSYPHSVTCSLLNNERNPGHSSIVTWRESGSRKSRMIGPQTLGAKMPFSAREIRKRIFIFFWTEVSRETRWSQPTPEGPSPVKKKERNLNIETRQR